MRVISSAAAVVLLAGLNSPASAQTPEQFYAGKNIDFVIGYPTGGANDVWARVIARHIGKHIPGKPNVIPKNQPGAGSFLAVNTVYSVSPKDGTVQTYSEGIARVPSDVIEAATRAIAAEKDKK